MKNSPEHQGKKEVSREEALAAYKKFIERGITKPDALDLNDPEVKEANSLFYAWQKQEERKAGKNIAAQYRAELLTTNFYVDAGFRDPSYLKDVRGWNKLNIYDVAEAIERSKKPDALKEIQQEIQRKIAKINRLLKKQEFGTKDAHAEIRRKIGDVLVKKGIILPAGMPEMTPEELSLIKALREAGPNVQRTKRMHKKWLDEEWAKILIAEDRVAAGINYDRRRAVLYLNAGNIDAAIAAWHTAREIAQRTKRMELEQLVLKEMEHFLGSAQ